MEASSSGRGVSTLQRWIAPSKPLRGALRRPPPHKAPSPRWLCCSCPSAAPPGLSRRPVGALGGGTHPTPAPGWGMGRGALDGCTRWTGRSVGAAAAPTPLLGPSSSGQGRRSAGREPESPGPAPGCTCTRPFVILTNLLLNTPNPGAVVNKVLLGVRVQGEKACGREGAAGSAHLTPTGWRCARLLQK